MECPYCHEPPVELFQRRTDGLSFWENLRGRIKCVHCDRVIKKKRSTSFWIALIFTCFSYLLIYLLLDSGFLNLGRVPARMYFGLIIFMLLLMVGVVFTSVLGVTYEKIEEDLSEP